MVQVDKTHRWPRLPPPVLVVVTSHLFFTVSALLLVSFSIFVRLREQTWIRREGSNLPDGWGNRRRWFTLKRRSVAAVLVDFLILLFTHYLCKKNMAVRKEMNSPTVLQSLVVQTG